MRNIDLVKTLLKILRELQVEEVIVCAGARNAPLVAGLGQEKFKVTSYFEERSAAFFALGKIQFSKKPVAIITTSGTAAAELLPAVIEAHYQGIPLIVITADRPKSYRGSGAPQAIEQAHLFQKYVSTSADWDVNEKEFLVSFSNRQPSHFNLSFEEPLIDGDFVSAQVHPYQLQKTVTAASTEKMVALNNPLVIVSSLEPSRRKPVIDFLKNNNLLFYAEFLSGLMNCKELKAQQVFHLEGLSHSIFQSVIRIGGIPTHRFWRDLESKHKNLPVISFSDQPFSGLARSSQLYPWASLLDSKISNGLTLPEREAQLSQIKTRLLKQYPNSEPSYVEKLSQIIGTQALYIGNSLPIREWDLFSTSEQKDQLVYANRGANGIDGQISTYLGWSAQQSASWCLVGDLTALYDLAALGLADRESSSNQRIVIMNNSGGKIFNRLFNDKKYLNPQKVQFSAWAQLWGWDFIQISTIEEFNQLPGITDKKLIIELKPDNDQSDLFWQEWDSQCRQ